MEIPFDEVIANVYWITKRHVWTIWPSRGSIAKVGRTNARKQIKISEYKNIQVIIATAAWQLNLGHQ